jgi:hypothetical protein
MVMLADGVIAGAPSWANVDEDEGKRFAVSANHGCAASNSRQTGFPYCLSGANVNSMRGELSMRGLTVDGSLRVLEIAPLGAH